MAPEPIKKDRGAATPATFAVKTVLKESEIVGERIAMDIPRTSIRDSFLFAFMGLIESRIFPEDSCLWIEKAIRYVDEGAIVVFSYAFAYTIGNRRNLRQPGFLDALTNLVAGLWLACVAGAERHSFAWGTADETNCAGVELGSFYCNWHSRIRSVLSRTAEQAEALFTKKRWLGSRAYLHQR